jgi:hypothetical protein
MPDTYIHDGSSWRRSRELYLPIYPGGGYQQWVKAKKLYCHDGSSWRLVFDGKKRIYACGPSGLSQVNRDNGAFTLIDSSITGLKYGRYLNDEFFVSDGQYVYRRTGGSWQQLSGITSIAGSIKKLEVYNGELYVTNNRITANGGGIYVMDGSYSFSVDYSISYPNSLAVGNGLLYCSLDVGGNVYGYNGTAWGVVGTAGSTTKTIITSGNNDGTFFTMGNDNYFYGPGIHNRIRTSPYIDSWAAYLVSFFGGYNEAIGLCYHGNAIYAAYVYYGSGGGAPYGVLRCTDTYIPTVTSWSVNYPYMCTSVDNCLLISQNGSTVFRNEYEYQWTVTDTNTYYDAFASDFDFT